MQSLKLLEYAQELYAQELVLESLFNKVVGLQHCCKTFTLTIKVLCFCR